MDVKLLQYHSRCSQLVEVRRFDFRAVPADIAPAEIVCHDDYNVWSFSIVVAFDGNCGEQQSGKT